MSTVPDFLHLTRLWCQVLEHHHHIEESYLFGAFEALLGSSAPENAMAANVEGHKAFMANLRLFKIYAERTSPEEFCGMTFRNIIDAFAEEFVEGVDAFLGESLVLVGGCARLGGLVGWIGGKGR